MADLLSVVACGDVMTGRGLDQALPHAGNPRLYECCVRDAREYLRIAETANGPIPRPVAFTFPWGQALPEFDRGRADARIINLETSITSGDAWPGKGIHYRMHPGNIGVLTAAGIDGCGLANDHVLDWGRAGLIETLEALDGAGIKYAGAGRDADEAESPAILTVPEKGRLLLYACGSACSGISEEWRATAAQPGVHLLPDFQEATAKRLARRMGECRRPGDVVIASIHWGGNWGYEVPEEQVRFARTLVEGGVDLVHGHSSHHVRALELYRNRLILYGCGDFLNDYEGIGGYEAFRAELRLLYHLRIDPKLGEIRELRLVPLHARQFRLVRAAKTDAEWLAALMTRLSAPFEVGVQPHPGQEGALRALGLTRG